MKIGLILLWVLLNAVFLAFVLAVSRHVRHWFDVFVYLQLFANCCLIYMSRNGFTKAWVILIMCLPLLLFLVVAIVFWLGDAGLCCS